MKFTKDDFDAWRANPLTEFLFDKFLRSEMDRTRQSHDDMAWGGPLEPEKHASYRERYETLEYVTTLTFEDIEEWMKEQQS